MKQDRFCALENNSGARDEGCQGRKIPTSALTYNDQSSILAQCSRKEALKLARSSYMETVSRISFAHWFGVYSKGRGIFLFFQSK